MPTRRSEPRAAKFSTVTVFFDARPPPLPQAVETPCGDAGVVDGMLGIAVTEIILDEALVETVVGE